MVGLGHGTIPPIQFAHYGLSDWLNGDIDHANLQWLTRRHGKPSDIFHLAGGSNVGRSVDNPLEDFNRTVVTAGHLFEWIRLECKSVRTTIVSSAAVYGEGQFGPIAEDFALKPFSPYGAHKAMMEQLARSYAANYQLNIAICRLFSVYGPGLEKQLVYDLCVKCVTAMNDRQESLELFGTGDELRDWIQVDDVCRILTLVGQQASATCPTYNGGSGIGVTVQDVAKLVARAFDPSLGLLFNGKKRLGDPISLIADTSRLATMGFRPTWPLEAGIQRVVQHFKAAERRL